MTTFDLDARVRSILRDIAADPRARLLRPDPAEVARAATALFDPPGPARPGATAAERELLAKHRDEVAELLRLRAGIELAREESAEVRFTLSPDRWCSTDEDLESWRSLYAACDANAPAPDGAQEAVNDSRAVRLDASSCVRIAAAAFRLRPIPRARLTLGRALARAGQYGAALRLARATLHQPADALRRSLAWDLVATCGKDAFGIAFAARAYRNASRTGPPRPFAHAAALLFSLQAGEPGPARQVARRIEDAFDAREASLARFTDWQAKLRERGLWAPTPEAAEALRSMEESLGTTSAPIAALVR